eukprot:1990921-Ditylum_brightwellii.AAC.1
MNPTHSSGNRYLKTYYWIGCDAQTFWKALHLLPTMIANRMKLKFLVVSPPFPSPPPDLQTVLHVTICVCSIEKSLDFYKAWGLKTYGETFNGMQFLIQSKSAPKTMVLLLEDPAMKPHDAKQSYQMCMTHLSLSTSNL